MECYASSSAVNAAPNRHQFSNELRLLKRRLEQKRQASTASTSPASEELVSSPSSSSVATTSATDHVILPPASIETLPPRQIEPSSAVEQLSSSTEPTLDSAQCRGFPLKSFDKLVVKWSCTTCNRESHEGLNVAGGSSGHRLKQHPATPSEGDKNRSKPFACTALKCPCRSFYYIVAEGAWILRCRCKHKHIDHDPTSYQCLKPKCLCDAFDSPWVCNCAHPWRDHVQTTEMKTFHPLQFDLGDELGQVHRTDLLAEPMRL
ncbi:hypothetical protein Ae201684P_012367 [Aphanomyces euteiches]|uniref:Protein FAM221A n=1 Tax=Aphanomyces euteiches TaxID=100861 RepID=A0A6G0W8P5_9STRA|nr:hypothetical protein Ae201684_017604 [Aphanomyces euteiches]KAH9075874.1 hypothetical protein Ae201684P_012367 [Aphanomyces euteiches]KAH9141225.1 hypothetical protein AeRB84_014593 [Aphanomyces euteiches]